jgi:hypothetical protein
MHPTPTLRSLAESAIGVFTAHPHAEEGAILASMVDEAGLDPGDAWFAYQIVPTAVCHVVFGRAGAQFPTHFRFMSEGASLEAAERRAWADEPLYRAASDLVDHLLDHGLDGQRIAAILAHSGEANALWHMLDADVKIDEIGFSESVVTDVSVLTWPSLADAPHRV